MATDNTGATGLAGRYATALFELAETEGALDEVADDLKSLDQMILENADLTRMIRSPVISRDEQGAAMNALLTAAGAGELARKFAGVLAGNRRLFALPEIIDQYLAILAGRRGEMTADVTSAAKLSGKQVATLEATLKRSVGGEVSINEKVDPDVLGGLVVKLGSRMVDSSLNTKLQQLRLAMRGVG